MTVTSFGPSREAADLDQVRPQLWRQWAPCLRRTEEQITMNDVIKVMLEAVATWGASFIEQSFETQIAPLT